MQIADLQMFIRVHAVHAKNMNTNFLFWQIQLIRYLNCMLNCDYDRAANHSRMVQPQELAPVPFPAGNGGGLP